MPAAPEPTPDGAGAPAPGGDRIPGATVKRLPVYLRALSEAGDEGAVTISSELLAARAGVNAAQVRKDLSFLGSYGTRGVGYDIDVLHHHINRQLGLTREYKVALVGVGNLGQALGHYRGFAERGFNVVAAFDNDPAKVGTSLGCALVHPMSSLEQVVRDEGITMALVATPGAVAQEVTDRLVEAGVTSLLTFAPVVLNVGPDVCVRKVDLAVELQILSYYQRPGVPGPGRRGRRRAAVAGRG